MAEKSKTPWVVFLLVGCVVLLLCCCCSFGLLVAVGSQGSLPDELQDQYDEQDFFDTWDEYTYEDDSTYDSNEYGDDADSANDSSDDGTAYLEEDCDFPNGDIEYWWYDVDEAMRECYRDMYGDPWFLNEE